MYEYYCPIIINNLIFGTRFEGFEITPIYERHFRKETGHHFHSGYLVILFYHGLFGFYLLYGPIFYYLYKSWKHAELSLENIFLYSFIFTGIFYSLSYILPYFYYGILGISFIFIKKQKNYKS